MYDRGSTGVAFMRRDGFVSMDAREKPGELLTRPVRFTGKCLFVNADVDGGELRAEIVGRIGRADQPVHAGELPAAACGQHDPASHLEGRQRSVVLEGQTRAIQVSDDERFALCLLGQPRRKRSQRRLRRRRRPGIHGPDRHRRQESPGSGVSNTEPQLHGMNQRLKPCVVNVQLLLATSPFQFRYPYAIVRTTSDERFRVVVVRPRRLHPFGDGDPRFVFADLGDPEIAEAGLLFQEEKMLGRADDVEALMINLGDEQRRTMAKNMVVLRPAACVDEPQTVSGMTQPVLLGVVVAEVCAVVEGPLLRFGERQGTIAVLKETYP